MMKKFIDDILGNRGNTPNKFTIAMGELIKKARKESNLSQAKLAKSIYIRQASISEIEHGKREVNSRELASLSYILNKPITYFFPNEIIREIRLENIPPLLQELLFQAERLSNEDIRKIIAQTRALADME